MKDNQIEYYRDRVIHHILKADARIAELEAENERLRERSEELTKLCSDRLCQRWDDNTEYRAEIERLRDALGRIINISDKIPETYHASNDCGDGCYYAIDEVRKIAREAMRQEGDER